LSSSNLRKWGAVEGEKRSSKSRTKEQTSTFLAKHCRRDKGKNTRRGLSKQQQLMRGNLLNWGKVNRDLNYPWVYLGMTRILGVKAGDKPSGKGMENGERGGQPAFGKNWGYYPEKVPRLKGDTGFKWTARLENMKPRRVQNVQL